jgi:hypothetical protein
MTIVRVSEILRDPSISSELKKVTQTLSRYISDRKLITEITYGRFHRSPKAGGRPTKQPVPPALGDFLV